MSLEVHVYGPGYGETIFLRWKDGSAWRGAVVDAHSPGDSGQWLADRLKAFELAELEFALATHPHLDHILNFAAGLELAGIHPLHGCYWPGLSSNYWIQFFERLAAQRPRAHLETARMVRQWFTYLKKGIRDRNAPAYDIGGNETAPDCFIERTVAGHLLRFKAIGPWLNGMNRLVENVGRSIARRGQIEYEHRHANDVSVALLIEYGEAQVVLGADMEKINWTELRRASGIPTFRPSLVKVSHHGSTTGRIAGMWPRAGGFFDGQKGQPIAVVTPWRQGGRNLPKGNAVLNEIREAGFDVYLTGEGPSPRYRHPDSHLSVRVQPDGAMEVFEDVQTRRLNALPPGAVATN